MNVLQCLTELYNSISHDSTYRGLIKSILKNLNKMGDISIYDVSELTNSSRTTIWRMVQKLGYNNFADFKHAIQNSVRDYTYYNRMMPKKNCKDQEKIMAAIKKGLYQSYNILEENLSPELLDELVDELYKVDRISFYLPFKLPFISSFQQNLSMAGKETSYCCLLPEIMADAEELTENSIVFVSTIEYAETLNMKGAFETIKKQGAKIWYVGNSDSRYSMYADKILLDDFSAPVAGLNAYHMLYLALSEYFRSKYID